MVFQTVVAQAVKKIFPPSGILFKRLRLINRYIDSVKRLKKRKFLEFGIGITDHCNLNCACCSAFSPVSGEGFYSVETFKKDCLRLFQLGGEKIAKILLAGGEPLLHPQITDFFDAAGECFSSYGTTRGGGGISAL
jgi:MoaA/NifB/PqqE/SkfB family radical SAM enzyme